MRKLRVFLADDHMVVREGLKALINAKRKEGYAKDTVRLIRAAISTVLTEAVDDELISANPALRLMAKSGGKARPVAHAHASTGTV